MEYTHWCYCVFSYYKWLWSDASHNARRLIKTWSFCPSISRVFPHDVIYSIFSRQTWCIIWVVIAIVPYGLIIAESGMNVTWATLVIPVLTCPFLWPLFLTITWSKATGSGMMAGNYCSFHISLSNAFWWYFFFYFLLFRTETDMTNVNVFMYSETKFKLDPTKDK